MVRFVKGWEFHEMVVGSSVKLSWELRVYCILPQDAFVVHDQLLVVHHRLLRTCGGSHVFSSRDSNVVYNMQ